MTTSASSQVRRTAFSAALALGIAQSHSSRLLPRDGGEQRRSTLWAWVGCRGTRRTNYSPPAIAVAPPPTAVVAVAAVIAVIGQRCDRCGSTPAPPSASASPASPSPPRYAASATAKAAAHTTTEASTAKSAATKSTTAATGGCLLRQSKNQQDCASDENSDPAHGHLREGLDRTVVALIEAERSQAKPLFGPLPFGMGDRGGEHAFLPGQCIPER